MWTTGLKLKKRALRDMDKNTFNDFYADLSIELDGKIEAIFRDDHPDMYEKILAKYPDQKLDTYAAFVDIPGLIRYMDIETFRVYLGGGSEAIFRRVK